MRRCIGLFLSVFIGILVVGCASALAESSSAGYILYGDAFTSGGDITDSANYIVKGTTGTSGSFVETNLSSTNYQLNAGFQALTEEPVMRLVVTGGSLDLTPSPLTPGAISSDSTSVTVGTNAPFGYTLIATALTEFQNQDGHVLNPVADGAVTAGDEEFGVAVSGDDAAFGDERSITLTPRIIAQNDIYGNDRTTDITFKVGISETTQGGMYAGSVVFIVVGNY